jgi:hypothetical protein
MPGVAISVPSASATRAYGGLRTGHELPLLTSRLIAERAVRAGVVGQAEGTDHELPRLDRLYIASDFFDDTAVFVAHVHGLLHFIDTAIRPEVRTANTGCR